ncbi:hypothetical protein AB0J21_18155 [Streptomyces sp. NPDC049954]|uniref:hypothetical protein n=1 Tax=Streptomyces sp. NPDC049954 TaxID=3155779 RepID=UPI0034230A22
MIHKRFTISAGSLLIGLVLTACGAGGSSSAGEAHRTVAVSSSPAERSAPASGSPTPSPSAPAASPTPSPSRTTTPAPARTAPVVTPTPTRTHTVAPAPTRTHAAAAVPTRTRVPVTRPAPVVKSPAAKPSVARPATELCDIRSNAGNCYRAGQFCRGADTGRSTTDASGRRITCGQSANALRWHY